MTVLKNINFKVSNSWVDAGALAWPVGSIYMSTSSTSPATYFGGTWDRLKSRFLLGADDSTYKAAATGGASTVTLTVDQIPSHQHGGRLYYSDNSGGNSGHTTYWGPHSSAYLNVEATGGGKPHNNMPPYLVVYMWKRTA